MTHPSEGGSYRRRTPDGELELVHRTEAASPASGPQSGGGESAPVEVHRDPGERALNDQEEDDDVQADA